MDLYVNKNIDLITFTGSVGVGKLIAENAGYKRTVLELGGNDPLIVLSDLDDYDLNKAADLAIMGATKNSGQRCTAVKRILVQESVADGNERFLFEIKIIKIKNLVDEELRGVYKKGPKLIKDPVNHLSQRIIEEISGETQFRLFVKK